MNSIALLGHNTWTLLPPLALRGTETALVESLTTYVIRLCHVSGIPIAHLLRQVTKMIGRPATLAAGEAAFDATVQALESLTGTAGLARGSFRWFRDVIIRASLSSKWAHRKWCPTCYLHWDDSSWEPLIWSIDLVERCPVHECDLEATCPFCDARQPNATPYARRRKCIRCYEPLAHTAQPSSRSHYQQWVERQVMDLLELCATSGQLPLQLDTFSSYLDGLERTARSANSIPFGLTAALGQWKGRSRRGQRVEMRTLINLCSLQAISLRQMLLDPRGSASTPLLSLWDSFVSLPLFYGPQQKKAHAFEMMLRRLLRKLAGRCLPAMQEVLRVAELTCEQAKDLKPDIYVLYQAAYLAQGNPNQQTPSRRALRASLRLLAQHEPWPRFGRPKILPFAADIARVAKVSRSAAVVALDTAWKVRRVLREAKSVLASWQPLALEDPAWTRGFAAPRSRSAST